MFQNLHIIGVMIIIRFVSCVLYFSQ